MLRQLRQAKDLADRHYADPLDLAELAAAAHVSKHHFVRAFAATYGETPMRYLTRRRVERAQDLLRSANLTVTEVCMLVGFSSLGSFSSRFRELVGESPTRTVYVSKVSDTAEAGLELLDTYEGPSAQSYTFG